MIIHALPCRPRMITLAEDTNKRSMSRTWSNTCNYVMVNGVKVWVVMSFLFLHYYVSTTIVYVLSHKPNRGNFISLTFTNSSLIIMLYYFLCRRRRVRQVFQDLMEHLKALDPVRYALYVHRCKICLVVSVIYVICNAIFGYYSASKNSRFLMQLVKLSYYCFDCQYESPTIHRAMLIYSFTTYPAAILGINFFLSSMYCLMSASLTRMGRDIVDRVKRMRYDVQSNTDNLNYVTRHFNVFASEVDNVNDITQSVIFLWYGSTLLGSCNSLMYFVMAEATLDTSLFCYNLMIHYKDFLNIMVVTFMAAKVNRVSETCLKQLGQLDYRVGAGLTYERAQLLFSQIASRKASLNIGGCFPISNRLFLSFLGLGVTYSVVFMQFNPQVVSILSGLNVTNRSVV